ncbi:hypothetical protein OsI_03582 [Oryza sativa Indica Group]|uniref:Uncharacterized protein n=1 Tax=Oryza sativa subsp. indica TaxID=39946 RepID=A2WUM9_ORYSI|nr:hypothetical protein OsI_03582 [Oryza sativa Indica Group]
MEAADKSQKRGSGLQKLGSAVCRMPVRPKPKVQLLFVELKKVVGLQWEWKVKQLNDKEFLINFPSDDVRSKISTCKSFDFETSLIKASVVETGMTEEAVDELVAVWVKVYGIPKIARNEDAIKSIAELVGEFEALDGASIRRDGPIRVRVALGYLIRWEPEGYSSIENRPIHPDDDDKDDKDENDGNEDMNVDEDYKMQSPTRGRQNQNTGASSRGGHSAPPAYKGKEYKGGYVKKIASKKTSTISSSELVLEKEKKKELVSLQQEPMHTESTELVLWEKKMEIVPMEQESQEIDFSLSAPLHSQEKEFSGQIDAALWDDELEKCAIPTDSDIERLREEEDKEEEISFQEVSHRKKGKSKSTEPAISSRMSLRNREMATIPVTKRAEILTQKKNLETPGNNSNPFAIFQLIDAAELNAIAVAANINLGNSDAEINSNIETLRAKELVQASLAAARWKMRMLRKKS